MSDAATGAPPREQGLELFAGLPRRYDRLAELLSLGQEPRWRAAMIAAVAPAPSERVLDVATGTGLVAAELIERTGCSVVGVDRSPEMLAAARARLAADTRLRGRYEPIEGDAESLPFADGEFDHLTCAHLMRYLEDPQATLRELARVVRPGGRLAAMDFGVPDPPLWRTLWWLYTRVGLPALGRLDSRAWYDVGRFLGPSISGFNERFPLPRLIELWRGAGIDSLRLIRLSRGGGIVIWGVKRGDDA